jgi:hypothetical protein
MADRIDRLEGRIEVVEGKVDQLASAMSAGFQAVDEAFREQREYTEFCFARLEQRMDAGFAKVDDRLALLGAGLSRVERKLDQFIDVQSRANDLVERRLRALE